MPDFSLERPPVQSTVNKKLVDTLGLQLEALREAADYAIRMTYLTYAEGMYLSAHGAWVDLVKKPGENDNLFRNKVHARLRMERNTLNSIKSVVSDYAEEFIVQDMQMPSCSFILGVSQLGGTARLFSYNQAIKGVLVIVPDALTIAEVRALLADLHTVKEAAVRIFILQEGKGIVVGTDGTGAAIFQQSQNQTPGTGGATPTGLVDPNIDFSLYPNMIDSSGTIVGSTLNKTTTLFGIGVDSTEIIPQE